VQPDDAPLLDGEVERDVHAVTDAVRLHHLRDPAQRHRVRPVDEELVERGLALLGNEHRPQRLQVTRNLRAP
jgi:hypothetical protein